MNLVADAAWRRLWTRPGGDQVPAMDGIRTVLDAGADPDAPVGWTGEAAILIAAAESPDSTPCIKAILAAGGNPDAASGSGRTALAILAGRRVSLPSTVIHALLDAGADPSAADHDGRRPLHALADSLDSDAVAVAGRMIDTSADVLAADRGGITPWRIAAGDGSASMVGMMTARTTGMIPTGVLVAAHADRDRAPGDIIGILCADPDRLRIDHDAIGAGHHRRDVAASLLMAAADTAAPPRHRLLAWTLASSLGLDAGGAPIDAGDCVWAARLAAANAGSPGGLRLLAAIGAAA